MGNLLKIFFNKSFCQVHSSLRCTLHFTFLLGLITADMKNWIFQAAFSGASCRNGTVISVRILKPEETQDFMERQQHPKPFVSQVPDAWPFLVSFHVFNTVRQGGWGPVGVFLKTALLPEPNLANLRWVSGTLCQWIIPSIKKFPGWGGGVGRQKNTHALNRDVLGLLLLENARTFYVADAWMHPSSETASWAESVPPPPRPHPPSLHPPQLPTPPPTAAPHSGSREGLECRAGGC